MRLLSNLFGCLRLFFITIGGKQPISIFTDQDQAMANAIKEVFPKSRHRLCLWHISQNAKKKKKLAGLYSNHDFHESFNKCLYGNMNVMDFEATWSAMIEKHKQQNNDWLNRLFHVQEKWCPSFNVDFFLVRMKSTQ